VLLFNDKKMAISLNCTDWANMGKIARIQIKSTLKGKIKIREFKSSSVRCTISHTSWKKSLLFVQFWAAHNFSQKALNGCIRQHFFLLRSTANPTYIVELLPQCTKFHQESVSLFRQSNKISPTPAAAPSPHSDGIINRDVKANQIGLNILNE